MLPELRSGGDGIIDDLDAEQDTLVADIDPRAIFQLAIPRDELPDRSLLFPAERAARWWVLVSHA
jgi:hypothetical protein